ncbi:MAG: DEAD/DEAH box helicase [Alistipes sp.]
MTILRGYQSQLKSDVYNAWDSGAANVMAVLPTGGGKTAMFSDVILDLDVPSCAIAHRQELVGQISTALARNGVRHRLIGPPKVIKMCVNLHMEEMGKSFIDPNSWHAVAGVDTLVRRGAELESWLKQVKLGVGDEFHHFLQSNKWGRAAEMFPSAKWLGVTATPCRADGKGLGRHADGIIDAMVEGPTMRELIEMGYLTDYRIFTPPSDFSRPDSVGNSGDYTRDGMRKAAKESHIVGDVVAHYLRIAPGKLGVTFVPDLDTAAEVAAQFNAQGVPAAVVSGETPDEDRIRLLREFKNKKLMQLVNVDLFGEGFDLPAIEVISFARPTESLSLYIQQFGRVLRLMLAPHLYPIWESLTPEQRRAHIAAGTKPHGIIIDHVGNVERHRLPDAYREWSLDRRDRRGGSKVNDGIPPMWTCKPCQHSQEKVFKSCLNCGLPMPEPIARSGPEFVDGDLIELDPFILEKMRSEKARVDMHPEAFRVELSAKRVPMIGQQAQVNRHIERQFAQTGLRDSLAWWGGYQRALGRDDSESYRRFYFTFGVDVLTAQTLGTKDATALKNRVDAHLTGVNRT